MKMKQKKIIYYMTLAISVFLLSFGIYSSINKKYQDKKIETSINEVVSIKSSIDKEDVPEEEKFVTYRKEYNNDDIVGNLKIANSKIDTLLVQTKDNKYYLNHLVNKEYSVVGSVFVDYQSNIESGRQINIYGHNSKKYDIPFVYLTNYLDVEYIDSHKLVELETDSGLKTFEIFSVKVVTDDIEHTKINFESDDAWLEHISKLRKDSLYDSNQTVDATSQILVMQTCLFDNPLGNYLIVSAKEI